MLIPVTFSMKHENASKLRENLPTKPFKFYNSYEVSDVSATVLT